MYYQSEIKEDELKQLFRYFSSLFQIRIAYISTEDEESIVGEDKPTSEYCTVIKSDPNLGMKCQNLYQSGRIHSTETKTYELFTCHGGLICVIVPLFENGILQGFISIGQFRQTTECPPTIKHKLKEFSDPAILGNLFARIPYLRAKEIENILGILVILAKTVLSRELVCITNNNSLTPLIHAMQSNLNKTLSLSEAAKIVCKSESRLSHLFQENFGKSFKQIQAEIKLDFAEKIMKSNPEITSIELSMRLGFKDPAYFSKYYKVNRGRTIKEFKDSLGRGEI